MKQIVLLSFILVLSYSCANKLEEPEDSLQAEFMSAAKTTVSYSDAYRFTLGMLEKETKSVSNNTFSIEPVCDNQNDTLMYLVNMAEGWKILSADKRTPAIIGWSEGGHVSLDSDNAPFNAWLSTVKADMRKVRNASDEELSFTADEINRNISRWDETPNPTRGKVLEIDVIDTLYYSEPVDWVEHMVKAHWDQGTPYNEFCPINPGGGHYSVGCAGVAGGGMLHYLYEKNGYPTVFHNVPMDSIGVNYSYYLTDSTRVTARYLKAVNDDMSMMYLSGGSAAFPSNVVSFFNSAGYSCSYSSFDVPTVKSSLLAGNPVMVLAFQDLMGIPEIPDIFAGHYFLIDGYQTRHDVIAHHIYSIGANGGIIPYSEHTIYVYISDPYLAYVKMNWGWWDQWVSGANDGWFALTSSWVTTNGTYDVSRNMFYNFHS